MKTALIAFGIIVALAIAFVWMTYALAMRGFRRWPAEVWRQKLLAHEKQLEERVLEIERELSTANGGLGAQYDSARDQYVNGVSLNGLMQYPNIGPGTVLKLNEAGCYALADVAKLEYTRVPGIGPVKVKEIQAAVRDLAVESLEAFNEGQCPEGMGFHRQFDSLPTADRDRIVNAVAERDAHIVAITATQQLFAIVRNISFHVFARNIPIMRLSAELMARPLPTPTWMKADQKPKPAVVPIPPEPPPVRRPTTTTASAKAPSAPHGDLFQAALKSGAAPVLSPHTATNASELKLIAITRFAYLMAKCDGRVAKAERLQIRMLLMSLFGHDAALARAIDPLMETTEKSNPKEASILAEVKRVTTRTEQKTLLAFVDAMATGSPSGKKSQLRTRIATDFGEVIVETPKPVPIPPPAPAAKPVVDHRAVLEIEPGMAFDANLIRRRYAMLTEKMDPAKAAAMGPEFAKMAETKRTAIRAAAEALMAPFGEPLEKLAPEPPKDLRHNPDLDDVFG